MKKICPSIFLLFPIGLILLAFVSCGPVMAVQTMSTSSNTAFDVSTLASGPVKETLRVSDDDVCAAGVPQGTECFG